MILKHLKYLLLLLLTFLLGAQPTHAKTEVLTPTYQKVFVHTATTQPSTLKKAVQPNVGFLSRKLSANAIVVVEGISARNKHVFSGSFVGALAQAESDLFSSFTHLKNLPTEAKTFLSAKNWDNALLTKLDGDLVSGYYPPHLHNQSFSRPFAGTFL